MLSSSFPSRRHYSSGFFHRPSVRDHLGVHVGFARGWVPYRTEEVPDSRGEVLAPHRDDLPPATDGLLEPECGWQAHSPGDGQHLLVAGVLDTPLAQGREVGAGHDPPVASSSFWPVQRLPSGQRLSSGKRSNLCATCKSGLQNRLFYTDLFAYGCARLLRVALWVVSTVPGASTGFLSLSAYPAYLYRISEGDRRGSNPRPSEPQVGDRASGGGRDGTPVG